MAGDDKHKGKPAPIVNAPPGGGGGNTGDSTSPSGTGKHGGKK